MAAKGKPKLETRDLAKLKKYPLQSDFFDDMDNANLQGLVDDIGHNGLRDPIEILPNNSAGIPVNTIVSGHQRRRALRKLGKTVAEVLVRHDLAEASREEIDRAFLESNLSRRQLDPLAKACAVRKLYESRRGRPVNNADWSDVNDAREYVGKMVGMSGRNLGRYWNVLNAPVDVQNALRQGKLTLTIASQIGCLREEHMNEIAERIRNGDDPKVVAKEYLAPPKKRDGRVITNGMKNLNLFVEQVGGHAAKLGPPWMQYLPLIKQAQDVIGQIIDRFANADAVNAEFAKNKTESAVPNSSICSK